MGFDVERLKQQYAEGVLEPHPDLWASGESTTPHLRVKEVTLKGRGMTGQQALDDVQKKFVEYANNPDGIVTKQQTWTERDMESMGFVSTMLLQVEPFKEKADPYLTLGWRATKGPQASNTSGFRAVGHRVLLSPDIVEETTESGIVLVKKTQVAEKNMAVMCTVLEIGHDCWSDKSTDYCEVGDRVLIGTYTGKFHTSPVDGQEYRFVMDTDIISPLPKDAK
jgi:co-chaperonin GroES (HSP10)